MIDIRQGDCLEVLRTLDAGSVHCCVTSPPYWGLRDYGTAKWEGGDAKCDHRKPPGGGHGDKSPIGKGERDIEIMTSQQYFNQCKKCGATCVDSQLGLEPTPELYVAKMVEVFREVRRVLRDDGTVWLNLGDSYARPPEKGAKFKGGTFIGSDINGARANKCGPKIPPGLKPKDLVGIPWRTAFALQADGWYLRSDIIWCLSGGTWVYARTKKGEMPIMVRDLARLKSGSVSLWNGAKWTPLLGMNKSKRTGEELELVLRSGERISCTPTHKFPTTRGLLEASQLEVGDVIASTKLPESPEAKTPRHIGNDAAWFAGLYIAEGSMSEDTIQISGHSKETERWMRVKDIAESYGGSATKGTCGNIQSIRVYGKVLRAIISELVTGRTSKNKGFSPVVWRYSNEFIQSMLEGYLSGDAHWDNENQRWRLGFTRNYNLERDLRTVCARLGYRLTLNLSAVKYEGQLRPAFRGEIRFSRSGHHNEREPGEVVAIRKARCREVYDLGVKDEPHLFALASGVLTHNSKPNPMPESVTDRPTKSHEYIFLMSKSAKYYYDAEAIAEPSEYPEDNRKARAIKGDYYDRSVKDRISTINPLNPRTYPTRTKRSVWTVTTKPYKAAHFATFPPDLIQPCILAGCPESGTVLDPFLGSGTTAQVARANGCKCIGIELNPEYVTLAERRLQQKSLLESA